MALLAAPARRQEPGAGVNADYLLCGLAASLRDWEPGQFSRFLAWCDYRDGEPMPDLRADHVPRLFTSHGVADASLGRCLRFASVPACGDFPGGLLCLAGLHPERAPQVLAGMRAGQWSAMSVGGVTHGLPGGSADLWPAEVSLVRAGDQADPGALVIGTGIAAAEAWELLAGTPAAAGA